jgi:hypothetical protein
VNDLAAPAMLSDVLHLVAKRSEVAHNISAVSLVQLCHSLAAWLDQKQRAQLLLQQWSG